MIFPTHEFGVMPFWFWNDRLDNAEIIGQIADFESHGVGGFVIHPRIGLPTDLSWMSDALLDHYEVAIREASRRGMKVMLYDEGMYPSGASAGQVVAENPAFACRCLAAMELEDEREPELGEGETLVCVRRLANDRWIAIVERAARSVIRGLHYEGEGPEEITHPAADILNPAAVAAFVRHVYQRFADRFGSYFGNTVVGIFTDEPSALGRPCERNVKPGTTGIVTEVSRILGYDFMPHVPALWYDDEPDAEEHRAAYSRAIAVRLEETFYAALHDWCEEHGLPLAGHPGQPDAIGCLRFFHIPGQDLVWRSVLPDHPSALAGPESTQAKCSSSAALHARRRRNLNECCGAYGHQLTWDEMCWLANWCLVRGVNLLVPHAFYYSVRGPRRDERPPDVGPNSPWWQRFPEYAAGCRRLCWLNTDSRHICEIAILGTADHLPWRTAKACFENQYDFNYLEERDLLERASIDEQGIHIADMCYRVLITEHEPGPATREALTPFAAAGRIVGANERTDLDAIIARIRLLVAPDVCVDPPTPALRVRHVYKDSRHWYMVFNEERADQQVRIVFGADGTLGRFDPTTGQFTEADRDDVVSLTGHALTVFVMSQH